MRGPGFLKEKSPFLRGDWKTAALIGSEDSGADVGDEPIDAGEQIVARHGAAADDAPVVRVDAVQSESL